jgi:hypothetical protein
MSVLRKLFVASPQRGEMFIARRSFLYSEAPEERELTIHKKLDATAARKTENYESSPASSS